MKSLDFWTRPFGRFIVLACFGWLLSAGGTAWAVTNGYITAVLRSACADAPPPPPVGTTVTGSNYVIMTVADADPTDWPTAQALVTDSIFESLMPLYCALPKTDCVTDSVQWNIITYDADGNPRSSGCAASGCQSRSCMGYESGPPVIVTEPDDQSVNSGQSASFTVDASGQAPLNYQWFFNGTNVLDGATNATLVLPYAQTNQMGTYSVVITNSLGSTNSRLAVLNVNPGPAATNGYITAVLRSGCASAPPPPPVGATAVGSNYVIMTVADADPMDWPTAQALVPDSAFQSLMPLYCALPKTNCVTDSVQWNIITYDVNGNPRISGCAASGCQFRSCMGYESGPPVIITQPSDQSVNSGQPVSITVDASGLAPLSYRWVFNGTNVLDWATNATLELPHAQTNQAGTYMAEISNSLGSTNSRAAVLNVNPGPAATNGYITAVLRSACTSAPMPPPPVGVTFVGPDYVITTVADADPNNWSQAQQLVTDANFQSIMPLYCGLTRTNCVTDSVQWNIITYDVNGNPRTSGCAASGCQLRSCKDFAPPVVLPSLTIAPAPSSVGLSWPTNACDYILEQSSNMVDWYPVFSSSAALGGATSAQMPAPGPGHFYRLRHK